MVRRRVFGAEAQLATSTSSRPYATARGASGVASGPFGMRPMQGRGLGNDPVRRLLVGVALVVLIGGGLWRRNAVCRALLARPWLVAPCAVAVMALVAVDGVTDGQVRPSRSRSS